MPQCHSGQLEDTTHFGVMQLGIAGLHLEIGSCGRISGSNWGLHSRIYRSCMQLHLGHPSFPNLVKFACNILPLLASGCKVERKFSVLGKITIWQWSSLSTSTIANSMMCGKKLCGIWLPPTENQKFNTDLYPLEVY